MDDSGPAADCGDTGHWHVAFPGSRTGRERLRNDIGCSVYGYGIIAEEAPAAKEPSRVGHSSTV